MIPSDRLNRLVNYIVNFPAENPPNSKVFDTLRKWLCEALYVELRDFPVAYSVAYVRTAKEAEEDFKSTSTEEAAHFRQVPDFLPEVA